MAKIRARSFTAELQEGATDRKYQKARPDTATHPMNAKGNETVARNRRNLNILDGFAGAETFDKVNPGS